MVNRRRGLLGQLRRAGPGTRANSLEVFFDLVFVFVFFSIARVTSENLTPVGLYHGLLILALLWWCWCSHMVVANWLRLGEGIGPLVVFPVMIATFTIALIIPQAFVGDTSGFDAPLVLAVCYLVVRALHLVLHWYSARDDPVLRRQILHYALPLVSATTVLFIAGLIPSEFHGLDEVTFRTLLWTIVVVIEYAAGRFLSVSHWGLASAGHWVERFELIIIVGLGETIISVGLGTSLTDRTETWPMFIGTALGIGITASLWWAYFDIVAPAAHKAMHGTHDLPRIRLARDAYVYLHLPMIAALILLSLGDKELIHQLSSEHLPLDEPQQGPGVYLAYGGVILFLLGHMAFQARILGTLSWTRVGAVVLLGALIPLAVVLPALAALGLLALVCFAVVISEVVIFADSRHELRESALQEAKVHEDRESEWRRDRYE
ncbi:low temperature requirement protein A [Micromonospora sp. NPDC049523]|uniref:low temperature requirement protein A n=1 Tax=Micromonospora sp. NPDC049523 TaxID=3155921 RepID=UPI00342BB395